MGKKIPPSEVKWEKNYENMLGSGGFGIVWKGEYKGQDVAIKCIQSTDSEKQSTDNEEQEWLLFEQINSEFIVKYYGTIEPPPDNETSIVLEYLPLGSLASQFHKPAVLSSPYCSWNLRHRIASEVISGLSYLHFGIKGKNIIHKDIKPDNILLSASWNAKLTDLGVSIIRDHDSMPDGPVNCAGTEHWKDSGNLSRRSDVYSFGKLLWYLVVGNIAALHNIKGKPITEIPRGKELKLKESLDQIIKRCDVFSNSQDIVGPLLQLIRNCLKDLSERPDSNMVQKSLSAIHHDIVDTSDILNLNRLLSMLDSPNALASDSLVSDPTYRVLSDPEQTVMDKIQIGVNSEAQSEKYSPSKSKSLSSSKKKSLPRIPAAFNRESDPDGLSRVSRRRKSLPPTPIPTPTPTDFNREIDPEVGYARNTIDLSSLIFPDDRWQESLSNAFRLLATVGWFVDGENAYVALIQEALLSLHRKRFESFEQSQAQQAHMHAVINSLQSIFDSESLEVSKLKAFIEAEVVNPIAFKEIKLAFSEEDHAESVPSDNVIFSATNDACVSKEVIDEILQPVPQKILDELEGKGVRSKLAQAFVLLRHSEKDKLAKLSDAQCLEILRELTTIKLRPQSIQEDGIQEVVFLMGATGSGKSTLANALSNNEVIMRKRSDHAHILRESSKGLSDQEAEHLSLHKYGDLWVAVQKGRSEQVNGECSNASIGLSAHRSETFAPLFLTLQRERGKYLVDLPGLLDSRGELMQLINAINTLRVMHLCQNAQVKVLFVQPLSEICNPVKANQADLALIEFVEDIFYDDHSKQSIMPCLTKADNLLSQGITRETINEEAKEISKNFYSAVVERHVVVRYDGSPSTYGKSPADVLDEIEALPPLNNASQYLGAKVLPKECKDYAAALFRKISEKIKKAITNENYPSMISYAYIAFDMLTLIEIDDAQSVYHEGVDLPIKNHVSEMCRAIQELCEPSSKGYSPQRALAVYKKLECLYKIESAHEGVCQHFTLTGAVLQSLKQLVDKARLFSRWTVLKNLLQNPFYQLFFLEEDATAGLDVSNLCLFLEKLQDESGLSDAVQAMRDVLRNIKDEQGIQDHGLQLVLSSVCKDLNTIISQHKQQADRQKQYLAQQKTDAIKRWVDRFSAMLGVNSDYIMAADDKGVQQKFNTVMRWDAVDDLKPLLEAQDPSEQLNLLKNALCQQYMTVDPAVRKLVYLIFYSYHFFDYVKDASGLRLIQENIQIYCMASVRYYLADQMLTEIEASLATVAKKCDDLNNFSFTIDQAYDLINEQSTPHDFIQFLERFVNPELPVYEDMRVYQQKNDSYWALWGRDGHVQPKSLSEKYDSIFASQVLAMQSALGDCMRDVLELTVKNFNLEMELVERQLEAFDWQEKHISNTLHALKHKGAAWDSDCLVRLKAIHEVLDLHSFDRLINLWNLDGQYDFYARIIQEVSRRFEVVFHSFICRTLEMLVQQFCKQFSEFALLNVLKVLSFLQSPSMDVSSETVFSVLSTGCQEQFDGKWGEFFDIFDQYDEYLSEKIRLQCVMHILNLKNSLSDKKARILEEREKQTQALISGLDRIFKHLISRISFNKIIIFSETLCENDWRMIKASIKDSQDSSANDFFKLIKSLFDQAISSSKTALTEEAVNELVVNQWKIFCRQYRSRVRDDFAVKLDGVFEAIDWGEVIKLNNGSNPSQRMHNILDKLDWGTIKTLLKKESTINCDQIKEQIEQMKSLFVTQLVDSSDNGPWHDFVEKCLKETKKQMAMASTKKLLDEFRIGLPYDTLLQDLLLIADTVNIDDRLGGHLRKLNDSIPKELNAHNYQIAKDKISAFEKCLGALALNDHPTYVDYVDKYHKEFNLGEPSKKLIDHFKVLRTQCKTLIEKLNKERGYGDQFESKYQAQCLRHFFDFLEHFSEDDSSKEIFPVDSGGNMVTLFEDTLKKKCSQLHEHEEYQALCWVLVQAQVLANVSGQNKLIDYVANKAKDIAHVPDIHTKNNDMSPAQYDNKQLILLRNLQDEFNIISSVSDKEKSNDIIESARQLTRKIPAMSVIISATLTDLVKSSEEVFFELEEAQQREDQASEEAQREHEKIDYSVVTPAEMQALKRAWKAYSERKIALEDKLVEFMKGQSGRNEAQLPPEPQYISDVKTSLKNLRSDGFNSLPKLIQNPEQAGKTMAEIFSLWTYLGAQTLFFKVKPKFLKTAHPTQILGALILLGVHKGEDALKRQFIQIGTGEGKSLVLAALAVTAAMVMDKTVHIICHSNYLTERDQQEFQPLYDFLDIDKIKYVQFIDHIRSVLTDDGDQFKLAKALLANEKKPDIQQCQPYEGSNSHMVLMDESDMLFDSRISDQTVNFTYSLESNHFVDWIKSLWSNRVTLLGKLKTNDGELNSTLENKGSKGALQANIIDAIDRKNDLHPLLHLFLDQYPVKQALKNIIPDILDALKDVYCNTFDTEYIAVKDQGKLVVHTYSVLSQSYSLGNITYERIFFMLREQENRLKKQAEKDDVQTFSESYIHSQIYPIFTYVVRAYINAFNKKDQYILGVSATLPRQEKTFEAGILKRLEIQLGPQIPSLFKTKKTHRIQVTTESLSEGGIKHFEAIKNRVSHELPKGRAVIVLFKNIDDIQKYESYIRKARYFGGESSEPIQAFIPPLKMGARDFNNMNQLVASAATKGRVTCITSEFGRGSDFRCDDMAMCKEDVGGPCLIMTFFPDSESDRKQFCGRVGRHGNPGSIFWILSSEDLESMHGFTLDELSDAPLDSNQNDQSGLLDRLSEKCNLSVQGLPVAKRMRKVQLARQRECISNEFLSLAKKLTPTSSAEDKYKVNGLLRSLIEDQGLQLSKERQVALEVKAVHKLCELLASFIVQLKSQISASIFQDLKKKIEELKDVIASNDGRDFIDYRYISYDLSDADAFCLDIITQVIRYFEPEEDVNSYNQKISENINDAKKMIDNHCEKLSTLANDQATPSFAQGFKEAFEKVARATSDLSEYLTPPKYSQIDPSQSDVQVLAKGATNSPLYSSSGSDGENDSTESESDDENDTLESDEEMKPS